MQSPHDHSLRALHRVVAFGLLLSGVSLATLRLPVRASLPIQQNVPAAQKASELATREIWMGMYMGTQKIGYASVRVAPDNYQSKPVLRISSKGATKLTLLGSTVEQEESQETLTDLTYNPLKQVFDVKSNGSSLHLEALYDYAARTVRCRLRTGDSTTEKALTIPPGAVLASDTNYLSGGKKLTVGQKLSFYYLEPLTVELQKADLIVKGREVVHDDSTGQDVNTLVTTSNMSLAQMTSWETEDGDPIRGEINLGGIQLTMVKQNRQVALDPSSPAPAPIKGGKNYTPPADFAVATAISTDKPIENPRSVRSLRVTISGVPDQHLVLSDDRQKSQEVTQADDGSVQVRMAIQAEPFDATKSARLPVTNPEVAAYLKKTAYLDTKDVNIISTAHRLKGKETNLYALAVRIRNWVHHVMTPDPSIGVPRSATDVFVRRRGVCRDYATLYSAIARAAGIPTRLCAGIVYANGKFFYHAWAESYVGEWLAFDPTLYDPDHPVEYVDATHIKFAQGDVTSMFDVVSIVGRLHITVQDVSS